MSDKYFDETRVSSADTFAASPATTQVLATPPVGSSLFITDILLSCLATLTASGGPVRLVDSDGTILVHDMYLGAQSSVTQEFGTPIKAGQNTSLDVIIGVAGRHTVTLSGYQSKGQ